MVNRVARAVGDVDRLPIDGKCQGNSNTPEVDGVVPFSSRFAHFGGSPSICKDIGIIPAAPDQDIHASPADQHVVARIAVEHIVLPADHRLNPAKAAVGVAVDVHRPPAGRVHIHHGDGVGAVIEAVIAQAAINGRSRAAQGDGVGEDKFIITAQAAQGCVDPIAVDVEGIGIATGGKALESGSVQGVRGDVFNGCGLQVEG